jgi:hemerythrin superfamily protein
MDDIFAPVNRQELVFEFNQEGILQFFQAIHEAILDLFKPWVERIEHSGEEYHKTFVSIRDTFNSALTELATTIQTSQENMYQPYHKKYEALSQTYQAWKQAYDKLRDEFLTDSLATAEDIKQLTQRMLPVQKTLQDELTELQSGMAYFILTDSILQELHKNGLPEHLAEQLRAIQDQSFLEETPFWESVESLIGEEHTTTYKALIMQHAQNIDTINHLLEEIQTIESEITTIAAERLQYL